MAQTKLRKLVPLHHRSNVRSSVSIVSLTEWTELWKEGVSFNIWECFPIVSAPAALSHEMKRKGKYQFRFISFEKAFDNRNIVIFILFCKVYNNCFSFTNAFFYSSACLAQGQMYGTFICI